MKTEYKRTVVVASVYRQLPRALTVVPLAKINPPPRSAVTSVMISSDVVVTPGKATGVPVKYPARVRSNKSAVGTIVRVGAAEGDMENVGVTVGVQLGARVGAQVGP